jgi:hypothetical protein
MALTITRPTQPSTFTDGTGRTAVVRNSSGEHFLVSEVHRTPAWGHRIDETLVFPCDPEGNVTDWSEVFSGSSVESVLQNFRG